MSVPPPRYPLASAAPSSAQHKIALHTTPTERRKLDDLSELYSLLRTSEKLEWAFARDAVAPDEYTEACMRLIAQYKSTERALQADGTMGDVREFIAKYNVDCPRAVERLITVGVPATTMHGLSTSGSSSKSHVLLSAEVTQMFITTMDAVNLNRRAVDEVQPLIGDLVSALNRAEVLVPGFNKKPLQDWLVTLNAMRAADELDDGQLRQLAFDLDASYSEFMKRLKHE